MARINEVTLSLAALEEMDGSKIARLISSHLQKLAMDCINRPNDPTARVMNVEFAFTPDPEPDTGDCERADLKIHVKSKVPTFKSRAYEMRVGSRGFSFNRDFPDELDQPALPFDRDEATE